jgi:hypothetical protein
MLPYTDLVCAVDSGLYIKALMQPRHKLFFGTRKVREMDVLACVCGFAVDCCTRRGYFDIRPGK